MPAYLTFRPARKSQGPAWLVGNNDGSESELVGYVVDVLKDAFLERLRRGLLARFPQNDPTGQLTAPDDALAAMGRDRGIVRGINEVAPTYAGRLIRWLDDWKTAGNPFSLMAQLAAYCGAGVSLRTVDVQGNWYSLNADGTKSVLLQQANWDWDGDPSALAKWSRFWVIIYPNGLWVPGSTWGDGHKWGDGRAWGSTMTPDEASTIRTIVSGWKPAGTQCVQIILAFDPNSFDPTTARDGSGLPDGTWGRWSTTGPVRVAARLSTARFLGGV